MYWHRLVGLYVTAVWWSLQSQQIRFPLESPGALILISTSLADALISRLESIHKQMRAHKRTHATIDRGCLCPCLSLQLLPVRGGHFQLGDTANIIIQSEDRQADRSNSFPPSVSLFVCICLSSSQQCAECIRWPWYRKCFSYWCNLTEKNWVMLLHCCFSLPFSASSFCKFKCFSIIKFRFGCRCLDYCENIILIHQVERFKNFWWGSILFVPPSNSISGKCSFNFMR